MRSGSSPRVRGDPACAGRPARSPLDWRGRRAHPRVCGATVFLRTNADGALGSSPRVRGDRDHAGALCRNTGLIPACAGRPLRSSCGSTGEGAHPRVCGATVVPSSPPVMVSGSSPRVRGDQDERLSEATGPGLIPACAGRPRTRIRTGPNRWAHPRVCGATAEHVGSEFAAMGSSPRVRGDPGSAGYPPTPGGLIPACAGRPGVGWVTHTPKRAHPRVCGATMEGVEEPEQARGSSPRVRGDRIARRKPARVDGLIPACAGRPYFRWFPGCQTWAHPRVCGATDGTSIVTGDASGSSPRVRGDPRCRSGVLPAGGLIPACAGRPWHRRQADRPPGAHPRVCGATADPFARMVDGAGSSPRVRGDLDAGPWGRFWPGLIPACAGRPCRGLRGGTPRGAHPRVCGATAGAQRGWR